MLLKNTVFISINFYSGALKYILEMNYLGHLTFSAILSVLTTWTAQAAPGKPTDLPPTNPFFAPSTLPFQAPAFDKIKNSDFKPAIEEGIRQHLAEIEAIANNPAAPTFENTFVAMEKSGRLLNRVNGVFNLLTGANTNPELQKVEQEEAPKLSANNDAIYLNTKLFNRVETLYQKRNQLKLDPESKRLIEYYYENFTLAGAKLSEADKKSLKALNQEEASLRAKFGTQLLAATKAGALVVDDKAELAGLSEAAIDAAAQNAKAAGLNGKYLISLQNTTQQPELQNLSNRATRQNFLKFPGRVQKKEMPMIHVLLLYVSHESGHKKLNCWVSQITQLGNCKIKWQKRRKLLNNF